MKRVKIMLTAVAVLAVVGGALAFKANRFNKAIFFTTNNPVPGAKCPFQTNIYTTTDPSAPHVVISATTIPGNKPCVDFTVTTQEQ